MDCRAYLTSARGCDCAAAANVRQTAPARAQLRHGPGQVLARPERGWGGVDAQTNGRDLYGLPQVAPELRWPVVGARRACARNRRLCGDRVRAPLDVLAALRPRDRVARPGDVACGNRGGAAIDGRGLDESRRRRALRAGIRRIPLASPRPRCYLSLLQAERGAQHRAPLEGGARMGNRGKWHVRHGARASVRRAPELERVRAHSLNALDAHVPNVPAPEPVDTRASRDPGEVRVVQHDLSRDADMRPEYDFTQARPNPYVMPPKVAWWRRLLDWFWT